MCPDLSDVFDEVLRLRDIGVAYLPTDLAARCRRRLDFEIAEKRAADERARRPPPAARSATPGDAFSRAPDAYPPVYGQ
eukprot:16095669-Heterocapsa_arctica.AAC.1